MPRSARAHLLRKEMQGTSRNRCSSPSIARCSTRDQDVLRVADAGRCGVLGPGLRWALMGPSLAVHVAWRRGRIRHFWKECSRLLPVVKTSAIRRSTPELKEQAPEGALQDAGSRSIEELNAERTRNRRHPQVASPGG